MYLDHNKSRVFSLKSRKFILTKFWKTPNQSDWKSSKRRPAHLESQRWLGTTVQGKFQDQNFSMKSLLEKPKVPQQTSSRRPNSPRQQDWNWLDGQKRLAVGVRPESAQKCSQDDFDNSDENHYCCICCVQTRVQSLLKLCFKKLFPKLTNEVWGLRLYQWYKAKIVLLI